MEISILAHEIGLAGEGLNFLGALVLALDLFQRPSERRHVVELKGLRDFTKLYALKRTRYKNVDVSSSEFVDTISDRHATRLGAVGVAIMALGFLCLMAYHWLEIVKLKA